MYRGSLRINFQIMRNGLEGREREREGGGGQIAKYMARIKHHMVSNPVEVARRIEVLE